MNYTLTEEQILANWEKFTSYINKYIESPRKEKLLELYTKMEDHIVIAPAAISSQNHNSIPGGYVDHINRVVEVALDLLKVWEGYGAVINFTIEELVFSCINHDLGKLGLPGIPGTLVNDNSWEIEKLGKLYKYNNTLPFSTVPDRSIFILQSEGIPMSQNEFLTIKIHDGLYEEANKAYLVSYQLESRLRSFLPILVHQADILASRVEWEREWSDKVNRKSKTQDTPKKKSIPQNQAKVKEEAMKRVAMKNPAFAEAFKKL